MVEISVEVFPTAIRPAETISEIPIATQECFIGLYRMLVVDDLKTDSGMVSHYMYISHCIPGP